MSPRQPRPFASTPSVELLAPAGDWDCLRAAVENGAHAVYFGLDVGFNARARAANFPVDDLPRVMDFLHQRGVRGYVAVNTLVFSAELSALEALAGQIAAAGADAVIMQDLGGMRLFRAICPELPIHASTQTTMTSAETIAVIERLGVERVILARELSLREIRAIRQKCPLPLEVFVHGALCVAYSGQCLTSESLGGRSANRGQCAQACRLPYQLICDGEVRDLGPVQYLLSPQDLAAYDLVPELIRAGVSSLKIEGRLKTPEYVANITRHYRQALDAALAERPRAITPAEVEEMQLSFSRGFSHGWLEGCNHKVLVPGLSSTKRGVLLGEIQRVAGGRVTLHLRTTLARGDGVRIDSGGPQDEEQGGRVYELFQNGQAVERALPGPAQVAFGRRDVDLRRVRAGHRLWKTDDPQLTHRLRESFAHVQRRVAVDLHVTAQAGEKLRLQARAENGAVCEIESAERLAPALRRSASVELLRAQLGRLGNTIFELREVTAEIRGTPMIPFSVLGQMRHALVEQLSGAVPRPRRLIAASDVLPALRRAIVEAPFNAPTAATPVQVEGAPQAAGAAPAPALYVLCRNLAQLAAALPCPLAGVYVDFHDIRQYRQAVAEARVAGVPIYLATPRIQKPDEMGIFRVLSRYGADGVLVRNLSGLAYFVQRGVPVVADFSLNAANELTCGLLREWGAVRITPSYDLNRDQFFDLMGCVPPHWLEVVLHQHMPMFHMEHCVFCAVLSPGTNKTNCGRPCDRHEVKLRDRLGMEHPLTADVGCRNTLFNAVAQSAAEMAPRLLAGGIRHFRLEVLDDSPSRVRTLIHRYGELLSGRVSGREVWMELRASNRLGVTRGTLEERRNPLAIL